MNGDFNSYAKVCLCCTLLKFRICASVLLLSNLYTSSTKLKISSAIINISGMRPQVFAAETLISWAKERRFAK